MRWSERPRFLNWWQLRVFGVRVHHGAVGALLCAGALLPRSLPRRLLVLACGAGLVADDWADRPWLR